jgi:hypothetical protein
MTKGYLGLGMWVAFWGVARENKCKGSRRSLTLFGMTMGCLGLGMKV